MSLFASRHGVWIFVMACLGGVCGLLPGQVNPAAPEAPALITVVPVERLCASVAAAPPTLIKVDNNTPSASFPK